MTVLTPSPNPTQILTRSNTRPILQLLAPALNNSLYLANIFHKVLSTTTFRFYLLSLLLLQQTYYVSCVLLIQSYYLSSILLIQSWYISKFSYWLSALAARGGYWGVKRGAGMSWKALEPVRQKLFREFMIFVLGGGNGVILALFWPGWIVVGPTVWGVWFWFG